MTKGTTPVGAEMPDIRYTAGMRGTSAQAKKIRDLFRTLEAALGAQHWWPAASPFEVVVGAYLTQNTAWTNVERAMENLRRAGLLSISGVRNTPLPELEQLIRPAGYFRQKAARLKRFVAHLDANHGGSLEQLFAQPTAALRQELLELPGIGPETADAILLYAASHEVFVVDSYTRRIFERHELAVPDTDYDEIRSQVEEALASDGGIAGAKPQAAKDAQANPLAQAKDAQGQHARASARVPVAHPPSAASAMARSELARRYNEFHALLVQTAKHYCVKAAPRCEKCPLRPLLPPDHPAR